MRARRLVQVSFLLSAEGHLTGQSTGGGLFQLHRILATPGWRAGDVGSLMCFIAELREFGFPHAHEDVRPRNVLQFDGVGPLREVVLRFRIGNLFGAGLDLQGY